MFFRTCSSIAGSLVCRSGLQCQDEGAGKNTRVPAITFQIGCAALQINVHDLPNRVPSADRDGEALILRCRRPFTRPPSRWSAALVEHPHRWVPSPVSATPKARAHKSHTVAHRGEGMLTHIYSRRPRLRAVFLCRGPGGCAVLISRCNARRINSEKLISSRRALSRRSCWISRGSRNVTGTLPFGSFVLGMN